MHDYHVGKGVYIWEPRQIQGGDPYKILERLQLAGVQSVVVKICDAVNVIERLEPVINLLRRNNIRVEGWGYSYHRVDPTAEARAVAAACQRYEISLYLIDVEIEVEGNHSGAERFMNALRPLLPNVALGLNTFWNPALHEHFPWKEYMRLVDFVCPQMYWRGSQPVEKFRTSQLEYKRIAARYRIPEVPMPIVAGEMYTERSITTSPAELNQFLDCTQTDVSLGGIFMWASDENETTPDLWKTFSRFPWRGAAIPQQPMGWAQAKVGMYVRAAPQGNKLGGIVKNQIVPVWHVENDWAAVNAQRTEWVFIGNPSYIRAEVDYPEANVPVLYKAAVTSGTGLKIREAPTGNPVGILRYKQVVNIYEERDGWARIDAVKNHWVSMRYIGRI